MTIGWGIEADENLSLIDGLPVGVYELTRDGRLVGTNRAFRYLVGADLAESPSNVAISGFLEARASSSTSGSDFGDSVREYELLRPDGSAIWVRDQSLWSSDSEVHRGVLHNVSARKASERALVSSERRHCLLVEMASNGIVAVNGEQQIVLFNQQAEELFGYRCEEIFGQALEVLIPDRFRQDYAYQMAGFSGRRDLSGTYSEQIGLVGLRKDGTEFPLELVVSRQELDGESLYTAIVRDVTERSEIERALQISEEQFRSFFESSGSAMLVEDFSSLVPWFEELRSQSVNDLGVYLDDNPGELQRRVASLRVVDANQAAVDLYEAGSRDAMCRPHRPEMFGFSGLASFRDQFIGIWNGQSHIELDVEARSWKGTKLSTLLHCVIPNNAGEPDLSRVMVLITNLSRHQALVDELRSKHVEAEKAHRELAATQQELIQAQRLESIGSLAAGIAHEINTPTQYVGDNVRFLQDTFAQFMQLHEATSEMIASAKRQGVLSEGVAAYEAALDESGIDFWQTEVPIAIEQTLEGVDQVATIVRALKQFSHPGSKNMAPIDINHTLESTITVARSEWKYVADISTDFDPELPLVPVLAGRLSQVFLNLILNAAHAIEEEVRQGSETRGQISVQTRLCDEMVEISVTDSGCGIPDEIRDRIFDPFFTTKEVGKGTGQGLSISRAVVVDQHSGQFEVQSEPGEGSTFTVRLPIIQSSQGSGQ